MSSTLYISEKERPGKSVRIGHAGGVHEQQIGRRRFSAGRGRRGPSWHSRTVTTIMRGKLERPADGLWFIHGGMPQQRGDVPERRPDLDTSFRQRPIRPSFGTSGPLLRARRGILGAAFGLNLNREGER